MTRPPKTMRSPLHAVGSRRAGACLASLLLLGLACVSKPPSPQPATVVLEVVRGAAGMPEIPDAPVHAVVDMRRPATAADPDLLLHATRRAARRHLASLSPDVPVGLVVLGEGLGETCGDPALIEDPPVTAGPELGTRLGRFAAEPPASLAAALELVSARLAGADPEASAPARVLVFSTLGSHCQRDVCAPSQRLVAQGAQLDWVVLGTAPAPECLAQLRAPLAESGVHAAVLPQPPAEVAFRIEPRGGHQGYQRGDRYVPAALEGRSGGPALEVAPGLVEVRIALETPLNLWPVRLSPDRATRIRVLDFPTLGLQRSFVDTEPEGWPWFVPRRFR